MRRLLIQATILAAIVIGCVLLCSPAHSAPADALRLYAGANAVWLDGPGAEWPADFEGSGHASASLTQHITLTSEYAQLAEIDGAVSEESMFALAAVFVKELKQIGHLQFTPTSHADSGA